MTSLFMTSCGADSGLRILVTKERRRPREYVFDQPFFLAGRDPRNSLHLDHSGISRRHAYFQLLDGRLLCVDLGSRAGVTLAAGSVSSHGWVAPPAGVQIGEFSLRPQNLGAQANFGQLSSSHLRDPIQDLIERPDWPQMKIEVSTPNHPPVCQPIRRAVTLVGSAPICRIRLRLPGISRHHCSLVWNALGLWLVDLLSSEGTRHNGERVSWSKLADGDEIVLGSARLRCVEQKKAADRVLTSVLSAASASEFPAISPLSGFPLATLDVFGPTQRIETYAVQPASSPASPLAAELASVLGPMMQQFQFMHQQIMEQSNQTALMMFRLFSAMHQDQMTLIREEMQQIQKTTDELQLLQQRLHEVAERQDRAERANAAAPAQPSQPPPSSAPEAPGLGNPAPLCPTSPVTEGAAVPPQHSESSDETAVHAWLSQRIGELQTERQSRWQRVVNFLRG